MSYVKIWVHAIWGTKNHQRMLSKELKGKLFNHIMENANEKKIYIDCINGDMEHIHCLLLLNADMNIAKVIQLIKGEATHWANKNFLIAPKLEWANEYFAVSVSESMLNKVREYIRNQEEHHKRISFKEEFEKFISKYNLNHHG